MTSYVRLRKIGEGQYSQVFLSLDTKNDNQPVALKRVLIDTVENEAGDIPYTTLREISILKQLQHPNIVRLLDVSHHDVRYLDLVFEQCACTLSDILQQYATKATLMPVPIMRSILKQMLLGVDHCHSMRIIHRDLKPANILLAMDQCTIKIADFGLARIRYEGERGDQTEQMCTLYYRAPEVLLGSRTYEISSDLWSLGCVAAELVLLTQPLFASTDGGEMSQLHAIFTLIGTPTEDSWPNAHVQCPCLQQITLKPIEAPPDAVLERLRGSLKRHSLTDSEIHEYEQLFEVICNLLHLCPARRWSARQALQHSCFK